MDATRSGAFSEMAPPVKRSFFGFDHPFFEPLWRRIVVVGGCLIWGAFEFTMNEPIWGMLFGGIGLVAGYHLFLNREEPSKSDDDPEE